MKVFVAVISYYFPMIVSQRQRVNWFVMSPDGLPNRVPIMQQFHGGATTGMKATSAILFQPVPSNLHPNIQSGSGSSKCQLSAILIGCSL